MRKKVAASVLLALVLCINLVLPVIAAVPELQAENAAEVWDLADFTLDDYAGDGFTANSVENNTGPAMERLVQEDGYTNINKRNEQSLGTQGQYVYMLAPDIAIPAGEAFTLEVEARAAGVVDSVRNEISVRSVAADGSVQLAGFGFSDAVQGSVWALGAQDLSMEFDATEWHTYRLVVEADRTSTLYIDGELAFENAYPVNGGNKSVLVKMGADSGYRCDMDVRALRAANGALHLASGVRRVVLLSERNEEGTATTLNLEAVYANLEDGTVTTARLVDQKGEEVEGVAAAAEVADGQASFAVLLPADLAKGEYRVKVTAGTYEKLSDIYTVYEKLSDVAPTMPKFKPVGYTIEMEDYQYNPNNEFNFPSVVDTDKHPFAEGETPIARYYLYYSPHDNPGGICLATSDSLEGPWTEYAGNPIVSNEWDEHYKVSHVSSSDVVWNDTYDTYFMYFHGENNVTRYATSDNLVDWEYGDICVRSDRFAPGTQNASYSRVFKHSIPGKGSYIMTTMVSAYSTGNASIYYAWSEDGVTWTETTTALIVPDREDNIYDYGVNVSGAFFMESEDRYFIICHGATGNMYLFEVGENLDQGKEWGLFYEATAGAPDMGRAAAPCFIQDDEGTWHMFYESGVRLKNNIVHAREIKEKDDDEIEWDLMDHVMDPWDTKGWGRTASSGIGAVTQKDGYVHVEKLTNASTGNYNWLTNSSVAIPDEGFTLEVEARVNGGTDRDGNEVSVRINQKLTGIFLMYGGEGEGYVRNRFSTSATGYTLDTTVWHTYTLVAKAVDDSYVTTLYVDGEEVAWHEEAVLGLSGGNLVRIGADNNAKSNFDIRAIRMSSELAEYVKVGTLSDVEIDSTERAEGSASVLNISANAAGYPDGTTCLVELVNRGNLDAIEGISAEGSVLGGRINVPLNLPAGLGANTYYVRVSIGIINAVSEDSFKVTTDRARPEIPRFEAQGYNIEREDLIYNLTNEFNFPSVVDTAVHGLPSGEEPIARYYLYYSPHNAPGGICLMTADSLEGPWTEYGENPLVKRVWPKDDGSGNHYSVSHVSAADVVWNEVYGTYFMYFHGENEEARYATSDDLVNWSYGDITLLANDFSPTGRGYTTASYGRVFEHEVPGLGNKYVQFITVQTTDGSHRIYWAHSEDGVEWTAVQTSLASPHDDEIEYGINLSGSTFISLEGRYFVVAHASTGDMYLFEVGESLDEEIHWGIFYDSLDVWPDYGRAGAPCFIEDDDGLLHMFYESGARLDNNIAHAREVKTGKHEIEWDLMDHQMDPWNTNGWGRTASTGIGSVTQEDGFVHVEKFTTASTSNYNWLTNSAVAIPSDGFTLEVEARVTGGTDRDGNEISVRINQKLPAMYLMYGGEGEGRVRNAFGTNATGYTLDTTQWHTYTLVVKPFGDSYVTTLYVDGEVIAWYEEAVSGYSGGNLVRIGADNNAKADFDIAAIRMSSELAEYVKVGSISGVEIDSTRRPEGTASTLNVTANTSDYSNGTPYTVELLRAASLEAVAGVAAYGTVQGNKISAALSMPEDLSVGKYRVRVSIGIVTSVSEDVFEVTTDRERPLLPVFEADGYTIELEDYIYNETEEFNFPSIVDTSVHGLPSGEEPIARYYLYYAPHDAPGGICLMTSDSLDGPWTEYATNPLVARVWPKDDGTGNHYSVSHVSAGDVVWNDIYETYFMYFHGENHQTRYATSDDLVNWTYGDLIVVANDFSPTGSGHTEASYGRVFEYEVPGLGNKYIMTIMINNSANMRKIFWAHSEDGIEWTAVTTALLSPIHEEIAYAGNLSGAYFFTKDDRCYVVAHASTGNMYLFEVGRNLDEEIHWDVFYDSAADWPDYGRSGAPCFMQDDEGVWHMFYEGGRRLHANIVHAKQVSEEELGKLAKVELALSTTTLIVGETADVTVNAYRRDGSKIDGDEPGLTVEYHVSPETIGTFDENGFVAAGAGVATLRVEVGYGASTVQSESVTVAVRLPGPGVTFETGTPMVDNAMTPNKTKDNLELPWVVKVGDRYHMYFSYSNSGGSNAGIALATADSPQGPWEVYNGGTPLVASAGGASVIHNDEAGEYWMYYNTANSVVRLATSTDGISWAYQQDVLKAADLGTSVTRDNAYQVSVYEQTIPGKDNRFVMFITVNSTANGAKAIAVAWSDDGISWQAGNTTLLDPLADEDSGNIASPRLFLYDAAAYVTYHNSSGNIGYAQLSDDFETAARIGTLYDSSSGGPDNGRAADGHFFEEDSVTYLFYTARSNKGTGAGSSLIAMTSVGKSGLLFFDDFEEGHDNNWSLSGTGNWGVVDDGTGNLVYQQSATTGGYNNFAGDDEWDDYAVEVEVTIKQGASTGAVTLSGRVTDAGNRYAYGFNKGDLVLAKRVNTADTTLGRKSYSYSEGQAYVLRLEFEGDTVRAYVDGSLEFEVTDTSHGNGRIGLSTSTLSAWFDNVAVYALGGSVPQPQPGVKLNDLQNYQVVQRSLDFDGKPLDSYSGEVTVSGTYTGEGVARVQAQVQGYEDGVVVVDWTDIAVADGSYTGTLEVPQGGWYRLAVRTLDDSGTVVNDTTGTSKWGVGIVILAVGQSNMMGQHKDSGQYETAHDLVANFNTSGQWQHLRDPYHGAGGSVAPAMGNMLVEELGIPVAFVPAADSGSGLHQPNIGHAAGRYWLNRNANNPVDTSTIYGKAVNRARLAGGVELIIWNQGETDGRLGIAKDVYMADMWTLLERFRGDLGITKAPMFIAQIGSHADNLECTELEYTAIRTAQRDLDDRENFFLAATEMEFDRIDTAHYTVGAMKEIGKRYANAVLYYYGLSDYYRGPAIVGAQFESGANDSVVVAIAHNGGEDITPETGITGFEIHDGDTVVAVITAERVDGETIRLTLAAAVSEEALLRYQFGFDPDRGGVVKDNTAMQLPLEATGDEEMRIEAAAVDPEPVDKSELVALIVTAKGYDEDDYTEASYNDLQDAIADAQAVVDDDEATLQDVADAITVLQAAIDALVEKPVDPEPVDKTALVALITEAKGYDEDDYTEASYNALQDAIADAQAVVDDDEATQQDVADAIEDLQAAIDALVEKPVDPEPVDKSGLVALIATARGYSANDYTEASYNALQDAIADAQAVVDDDEATRQDVAQAIEDLQVAIDALVEKPVDPEPVDKSALQALYNEYKDAQQGDYTGESWSVLQGALADAKNVLDDDDATAEDVADAIETLQAAIDGLETGTPNPEPADKAALQALYDTHKDKQQGSYTGESWSALQTALANAKTVLDNGAATQGEVDAARTALQMAVDGLKVTQTPSTSKPGGSSGGSSSDGSSQGSKKYRVTKGSGAVYTGSGSVVFEIDGELSKLKAVRLGGKELARGVDYTAESGSIIITLLPALLESLKSGSYSIEFVFEDGSGSATLTVCLDSTGSASASSGSGTGGEAAKTGDAENHTLYLYLALAACFLLGTFMIKCVKESI